MRIILKVGQEKVIDHKAVMCKYRYNQPVPVTVPKPTPKLNGTGAKILKLPIPKIQIFLKILKFRAYFRIFLVPLGKGIGTKVPFGYGTGIGIAGERVL